MLSDILTICFFTVLLDNVTKCKSFAVYSWTITLTMALAVGNISSLAMVYGFLGFMSMDISCETLKTFSLQEPVAVFLIIFSTFTELLLFSFEEICGFDSIFFMLSFHVSS